MCSAITDYYDTHTNRAIEDNTKEIMITAEDFILNG